MLDYEDKFREAEHNKQCYEQTKNALYKENVSYYYSPN